jgi:hypothetical protein
MKFVNKVIFVGVCILWFIVVSYAFYSDGFELGQTEALRGHQEYKMVITYQLEIIDKPISYPNGEGTIFTELITDTVYIPVDTTFVKK